MDAGIAPSTGSVGDSFDNSLAENLWSARDRINLLTRNYIPDQSGGENNGATTTAR
ncbi:hypothetical protein I1A62_05720 (plasmid) [Rhodococcus sp. USK10]|uniref:hypothetical protein n=1 Tax=Rhodococcus TaxID=1827 RepID=UPI001C5D34F9|nr:hypothetical protein [Rhodococcus sp. USK10]QYB00472.1 hypothetical protein I1A62_05620 [Rhodococcus sp. USK10]QYB00484.1 hypothetical protein I1A62_05720 [Rhodococcus sp. USK10]